MRRSLATPMCAIAVLVSSCVSQGATDHAGLPQLRPGAVVATTPGGFELVLAAYEGSPLVVNYWASWCIPCAAEMPLLAEAARAHEGRVSFLGVNAQDDEDAAAEFLSRFKVPFPSVADPAGQIMAAQKIVGLPVTRFYGSDGDLVYAVHGELVEETLTSKIDELLRLG